MISHLLQPVFTRQNVNNTSRLGAIMTTSDNGRRHFFQMPVITFWQIV